MPIRILITDFVWPSTAEAEPLLSRPVPPANQATKLSHGPTGLRDDASHGAGRDVSAGVARDRNSPARLFCKGMLRSLRNRPAVVAKGAYNLGDGEARDSWRHQAPELLSQSAT